jgi:PAS domain S-box-containing protein
MTGAIHPPENTSGNLSVAHGHEPAEDLTQLRAAALEGAAEAVSITDRDGAIIWVNSAFLKLTGYTREETIGQNVRLLKSGRHTTTFYRDMWETVLSGQI